jgi:hypothetical protein
MIVDKPTERIEQEPVTNNTNNHEPTPAELAVAIAFTPPEQVTLEAPSDSVPASTVLLSPNALRANLDETSQNQPKPEPQQSNEAAPVQPVALPQKESKVSQAAEEPVAALEKPSKAIPRPSSKEQKAEPYPETASVPEASQSKLSEVAITAVLPKAEETQLVPPHVKLPERPAVAAQESSRVEALKPVAQKDAEPSESGEPNGRDEINSKADNQSTEDTSPKLATGGEGGDDKPPAERSVPGENDESPEKKARQRAANEAATDIIWAAAAAKVTLNDYNEQYPYIPDKDETSEAGVEQTEAFAAVDSTDSEYRYLLIVSDLWKEATELHPLLEEIRQLEEEYEMARILFHPGSPTAIRQRSRVESAKADLKHLILGRENERVTIDARPKGEDWLKIPEQSPALEHLDRLFLRLYEPYGKEGLTYMAEIIKAGLKLAYSEAGYNLDDSARYEPASGTFSTPSLETIKAACNAVVQKSTYADYKKPTLRKIVEELGSSL